MSAQSATQTLQSLDAPGTSPWLAFGGITAPYAGVFEATGAASALLDPNAPRWARRQDSCPGHRPFGAGHQSRPVRVRAQCVDFAAQFAGRSGAPGPGPRLTGPIHGWNGAGALTPIDRFATMFSGEGVQNANGTEWYFPQRLTDDTGAVDNGNANPAQSVLDVDATMGHSLPKSLLIYAFGHVSVGPRVPQAAQIWPNNRASLRPTSPWPTTRAPTRTTTRPAPIPPTPSSAGWSRSWARSAPKRVGSRSGTVGCAAGPAYWAPPSGHEGRTLDHTGASGGSIGSSSLRTASASSSLLACSTAAPAAVCEATLRSSTWKACHTL